MSAETARGFLIDLNQCWQRGDLAAIADYYHPDVVLLPPDLGEPILGRDAVVDSYRDFLEAATLKNFEITSLEIFPFETGGNSATFVAHLAFDVAYSLDEDVFIEKGLEVYTISEQDGEMKILWRHQAVLDSRIEAKA